MDLVIEPYLRRESGGKKFYEVLVSKAAGGERLESLMIGAEGNKPIGEMLLGLKGHLHGLKKQAEEFDRYLVVRSVKKFFEDPEIAELNGADYRKVVDTVVEFSRSLP